MSFFALLKRSKIAREQPADRDGGEQSLKRSKREVLRELFRWNARARVPEERGADIEVPPPILEVAISGDDGNEQLPSIPLPTTGLKPADREETLGRKETPTQDDFRKIFSGAPQFSLLESTDASQLPQPRVTFPWDTDPRIRDLTDYARFSHPVFSLSTARRHSSPTGDVVSGEGGQSGEQAGYDIGAAEVPSVISAQGLEPGTVGYECFMMLPFADTLEEPGDEETGSSDDDWETNGRTATWRRRRSIRETPEGGKRIGMRSVEANAIVVRLQELEHLYHGPEDRESARAPLDLLKEQSSVQLYTQLFTHTLYPPDRVHNADADDPYSLKVQIEALVRALSATSIWHDFSFVETRLRLGELFFGDADPGTVEASAERRWLLLQILLSCELLVRLDAVRGSGGQELARKTLEDLVEFYGARNGKITWDIVLARRWLENVRLAVGVSVEADDNHNHNTNHNNLATSPTTTTTQDPMAKKKGTSWSWFSSHNPSRTPAAALQPPADADPGDIPVMIASRNLQRQISGLLYFAETLGWPALDALKQGLEERTGDGLGTPVFLGANSAGREPTARANTSWPLDTYLTSLILPGPSLSYHLIHSLLPSPCPPTTTNTGLIHAGRSYWNKRSIVGKVLAGFRGGGDVGGWVGGFELGVEGMGEGLVVVGEEEGSKGVQRGGIADLAAPVREVDIPPPDPADIPSLRIEELTLTPSPNQAQPHTATLSFQPPSLPPLPLTHNPSFLTSHPCLLSASSKSHPLPATLAYSINSLSGLPDAPTAERGTLVIDARGAEDRGVYAKAWCAAKGAGVVLVAREGRVCLGCAVREAWFVGREGAVVVWV
ncbi:MAG: hypothetical protein M1839_008442 [Geoglossum umbratile]|nr:MAG: hypothetical protein M1839_008442 [Geoglossum umbratile]